MNLLEGGQDLPFSENVDSEDKFSELIEKIIKRTKSRGKKIDLNKIEISTMSADIPIKHADLNLNVEQISEQYGTAFCIRERKNHPI